MTKYQKALENIGKIYLWGKYGNGFGEIKIECKESYDILQELVNRDNNHFAHILKFTEKDGRKRIIAFHSSQEADAFIEKNGIKSAHLDSIQFFDEGKE